MAIENLWAMDLPVEINTVVKTRAMSRIRQKYSNVNWTMDKSQRYTATFPSVYVYFEVSEVGKDLIGTEINAINCTSEVEVTTTKEQGISGARFVAGIIMDEYKQLGFEIGQIVPIEDNTTDLKRAVFRAERIIGQADIVYS